MPELTPLEAAEKLDKLAMSTWSIAWSEKAEGICVADLIRISASYLHKIAAGEYKQVVHAEWVESNQNNSYSCRLIKCSNCGETHIVPYTIPLNEWEKNRNYCGSCGALMDGKDDAN